ncbi:MAG: Fic family protein [Parabacteroides sp.]|nr:Fic family protein [Parabacteroides sp.]
MDITYPDTEAIFNGLHAPSIKVEEIIVVNNLKHAWFYLLDNLDVTVNYSYICLLNKSIGGDNLIINAGFIREVPVSIGGTSWKPDMPIEAQVKEEIAKILSIEEPTERAIILMLYLMRKQLFLDGNKRTSMLAGNQVMIANGCGIIRVPIEHQPEFTKQLVEYYESGHMDQLKEFIYETSIDGIDFKENEGQNNLPMLNSY